MNTSGERSRNTSEQAEDKGRTLQDTLALEEVQLRELLVIDELARRGIPRVIDYDDIKMGQLMAEYLKQSDKELREKLYWNGEMEVLGAYENTETRITIESIFRYVDELEFEYLATKTIAWLTYALEHPEEEKMTPADASDRKKVLQASFYVHYGVGLDSPWQRFFDEMIPVEGLSPYHKDDQEYIDEAYESKKEFDREKEERNSAVREAALKIGLYSLEPADAAQLICPIIGMQERALPENYESTLAGRAQRNKEIYQWGENHDIASKFGKRVLITLQEFFDDRYPIPPTNAS